MKIPVSFVLLSMIVAATANAAASFKADIEYGQAGGEKLLLDASVPEGKGPFPAVILVHGGGWTGADKNGGPKKGYMMPMHDSLTNGGFAWFTINYRLAPKNQYPAAVEDVETAIRWVKAHAAEYNIDPQRIAISGESAGGHLIALAVTRAKPGTRVAAVVPFYGRFDLADFEPNAPVQASIAAFTGHKVFDAAAAVTLMEASPLRHVTAGLPPFLLVHGTADASVPFAQSTALQKRLREVGVPCELITIEGGVHGMISWPRTPVDYQAQVVDWLKKTLAVKAPTAK